VTDDKLNKIRDMIAIKEFPHSSLQFKLNRKMFIRGFNASTKIHQEKIEKLVEALKDLIERHNYTGGDEWHIKALREFEREE
jgi:hypothetical protein